MKESGNKEQKEKDIMQAEQQTQQEQTVHFFPFNRPLGGIT